MFPVQTRADSLYEYLSGAAGDGGVQANPLLSLGGFASSTEAISLGIAIQNAIPGVVINFASGANPIGPGTLTAVDANTLTWKSNGDATAGLPCSFSGTGVNGLVEGSSPSKYLRLTVTTPLTPKVSTVTLSYIVNNQFGMENPNPAQAFSGLSDYRASIVKNLSTGTVSAFQRYIALLGTPRTSNVGFLPASGAGTIITFGSFVDWPSTGWCQIRTAGGTLKEVVYYSSRTNTVLTIPATGRALLGTVASIGTNSDSLNPTPGVAIAIDPAGVQAAGSSIQTVGSGQTSPVGVVWNLEITPAGGLQIGTLNAGQQVGLWVWRQIPAGTVSSALSLIQLLDAYNAY